jgi:hypothetical protein
MNIKDRAALRFEHLPEVDAKAKIKFKDFEYAWRNSRHQLPDGTKLTMKDALAMWEAPLFMPKVINNNIQEAVEPLLIATSLLQKVPFAGPGTFVDLPVMGALDGDFDIGEGEAFPEMRITYGASAQVAQMTHKYGLALKFIDESLRYNPFDVLSLATRQAARALARNKEEKIFNMLYKVAKPTHDNTNPLNSAYGTTTGRDLTGAQNGSITMDDIFEMFAQVHAQGYTPNLLILHPLTWLMFVQDAQLRAFAQMNQSAFFGSQWTGNPAHQDFPSGFGGMAIPGGSYKTWPGNVGGDESGNALPKGANGEHQNMQAAPVLPGYLGLPFSIVISPWAPYDTSTNTTSILMADREQLGFFIEEQTLQTTEWTDPETDIFKFKMWERYLIRPKNRGLGVAIAKNVVVEPNRVLLPAQSTINIAGNVGAATRNVAVP